MMAAGMLSLVASLLLDSGLGQTDCGVKRPGFGV